MKKPLTAGEKAEEARSKSTRHGTGFDNLSDASGTWVTPQTLEEAVEWSRRMSEDHRVISHNEQGKECIVHTFDGVPPKLYRYLGKREHARDAVERGRLRLGTLFGYLKEEGHNDAQYDSDEGLIAITDTQPRRGWDAPTKTYITSTDRWIVCLSSELSRNLMDEFEATSVLKVNVPRFIEAVARQMAERALIGSIDLVEYVEDNMQSLRNLPEHRRMAHIYKSKRYASQMEWRLTFEDRVATAGWLEKVSAGTHLGFGKHSADPSYYAAARTNGASGPVLEPVFVQSAEIARSVRDVTDQL